MGYLPDFIDKLKVQRGQNVRLPSLYLSEVHPIGE